MEAHLARSRFGRILLHLACAYHDHHYQWHWRGVCRELGWTRKLQTVNASPGESPVKFSASARIAGAAI